MHLAGTSSIDLRSLPRAAPVRRESARPAEPEFAPRELPGAAAPGVSNQLPAIGAAAPAPTISFDGLDFASFGGTYPPDANGDVGPVYYIQAIGSSVGIFRKSDGIRVAAFTLDTFMSQGSFGNLCDTNNQGDPVVLYDSFEDRWVITDFAFTRDGSGNVNNPPGAFQCFAVSKTGDPVAGGWNYYSIAVAGGLHDSPKFGIWTDGIYMSANLQSYLTPSTFIAPRVYALNKAQMYAGLPSVQIVSFDAPAADFSLLPGNARLQTGTPPAGTPNYFVSTWQFLNGLTVYKFHVDWERIALSSFTGPDVPLAATSWPNASVANAPSLAGSTLDVVQIRAMMQAQYSNLGGVESLWATHTVRRATTTGFAASRWYQIDVTGGTVAPNLPQAATWDPDGANVMYRFIPSLAVNRAGDLALGYTTSSASTKPALKYAGRLATDPINTFGQTEQLLIQGAGTQSGNTRWGDYSSMSLDPDGCTFWMTGEYYAADGLNYQTRIGSFSYPSCTPVGAGGSVTGTVTAAAGGAPLNGAVVSLGSRTTTTDAAGVYSFSAIPAGTYPGISASYPGCTTGTASTIVVNDAGTTTRDFALGAAAGTACLTDTTQSDFQAGVPTNIDTATSPGDVLLNSAPVLDQQNATVSTSGVGITSTTWGGQMFTPAVTGLIKRVDVNLFCSGCTGTTPNLTLSIRATSGGVPTGADLASATVTGFNSGASAYYTANFSTPVLLNAGTQYAFAIRPTTNPSPGTYALTRSGTASAGGDVYAGGTRVAGATSGSVWSIPLTSGISTDSGFRIYLDTGYRATGDLISAVKDANPAPGHAATWSTLSWNASVPANTSLQFQVAASNSFSGPFNFVGPDGTAGTFFTSSGASLSQFDNNRYLRYRALLATTDNTVSPTLGDVTVCHSNPCIPPATPTVTPGGPTTFCAGGSVTLNSSSASGNQWSLDGNPIGGATSQSFIATASGDYTTTTNAFMCASASSAITTVSVTPLPATPAITPDGPTTFYAGGSVTLTSSSPGGNQWYLGGNPIGGANGQQYVATAGGDYSVAVTSSGCSSTASAPVTVTVLAPPDLAISVSNGVTQVHAGGSTTYTITVTNNGPGTAPGATVADTFPAPLTCAWICTGAGSGTCAATGVGNINDTVNLPVNASVTYSATCTIAGSAAGTLSNTATVSAPPGATDPTPANNSATDTDTILALADLSLTVTDNRQFAAIGSTLNYVIVVRNAGGPSTVAATVSDALPAQLSGGSWTCVASGGASCANGSGNTLSDAVMLPVGGQVSYLYSATVIAGGVNDQIVNTAAVVLSSATDPVPANNSASDTTIVPIFRDGFDGPSSLRPSRVGDGGDFVAATLRIDARLLGALSLAPSTIASGRTADGRALFTLELARLGRNVALRAVTTDSRGSSQRSAWQTVNLDQRLLAFAWQPAADWNGAYLTVNGDAAFSLNVDASQPLTELWITAENDVPWLVAPSR